MMRSHIFTQNKIHNKYQNALFNTFYSVPVFIFVYKMEYKHL